ncbi:unnamed protein product [Phyllotreta striolata]|uniref:Uncharacterized protein n=1 Tax=Phyllotreta striolata TaxID=444603 RepID=A0A9N9TR80_PHYSR|nr:unnamed protein product [Phyllotreta striolata]
MKLLVLLCAVAIAASTQRILSVTAESYDDGSYHPDPSEDDGQYHPSADEAEYHDDHLGDYLGQAVDNGEPYKHIGSKVEPYKHNPDQLVPYKPFHDGGVYKQSGDTGVYKHVVGNIEPYQHTYVQNSGLYKDVYNNGEYKQGSLQYNQNKLNRNQHVNVGLYKNKGEDDGSYHPDHSGDYKAVKNDNDGVYRHVVGNVQPYQHTYVQNSGLYKEVSNNGGYKQGSYKYDQNQRNQGVNEGFYKNEGQNDGSYHRIYSEGYIHGKSVISDVNQQKSVSDMHNSLKFGVSTTGHHQNIGAYDHQDKQNIHKTIPYDSTRGSGKLYSVSTENSKTQQGSNTQLELNSKNTQQLSYTKQIPSAKDISVQNSFKTTQEGVVRKTQESNYNDYHHVKEGEEDGSYHPDHSGDYIPEKIDNGEAYRHVVGKVDPYKQNPVQPVPSKPSYDRTSYEHVHAKVGFKHENSHGKSVHLGFNQHESKLQVPVSFGFGQTRNNGVYKHENHENEHNVLVQNQGRELGRTNIVSTERGSNVQSQIGTTLVNKVSTAQNLNVGNVKPIQPAISPKYNIGQNLSPTNLRNEGQDDGSYHPDHSGDYKPEKIDNGEAYRHVVGKIDPYKHTPVQPVPSKPFYDRTSYDHVSAKVGYNQENNLNSHGKSINHGFNQHESKLQVPVSTKFGQSENTGIYKNEYHENRNNVLVKNQGGEAGRPNIVSTEKGSNVQSQISTTSVNKFNTAQNLNVGNVKPIQPAISPKYNIGQNLSPTNLRNEGQDDGSYHPDHSGDYKPEKIDNGEAYRHVVGKIDSYKHTPVQPVPSKPFYDRASYDHVSAKVDYNQENNLKSHGKSINLGFNQHESKLQVPVSSKFGQAENTGIYKNEYYENRNNVLVKNQGGEVGRTNIVSTGKGSNVQSQISTTSVNKVNTAQNLNVGNVKPIQPAISPKYNIGQNLSPINLKNEGQDDGSYHPDHSGDYKPEKIDNGEAYRHVVGKIDPYKQSPVQPVHYKSFNDRVTYEHVSTKLDNKHGNNLKNDGRSVISDVSLHKSVLQGFDLQSQFNAGNHQYQAAYEKQLTTSRDNTAHTFTVDNMKLIHTKIQSSILSKYNGSKNVFDGYQSVINRKTEEFSPTGYHYVYQNENGIIYEEVGHIIEKETHVARLEIRGFYSFHGLDKNLYTVEYSADSSNGYLLKFGKVVKIATLSKGAEFCIHKN